MKTPLEDFTTNTGRLITEFSDIRLLDSTLDKYEDILVCLYGLPIKNINRNLLLPNENTQLKRVRLENEQKQTQTIPTLPLIYGNKLPEIPKEKLDKVTKAKKLSDLPKDFFQFFTLSNHVNPINTENNRLINADDKNDSKLCFRKYCFNNCLGDHDDLEESKNYSSCVLKCDKSAKKDNQDTLLIKDDKLVSSNNENNQSMHNLQSLNKQKNLL